MRVFTKCEKRKKILRAEKQRVKKLDLKAEFEVDKKKQKNFYAWETTNVVTSSEHVMIVEASSLALKMFLILTRSQV